MSENVAVVIEEVDVNKELVIQDELSFSNIALKKELFISKIENVVYVDETSFTTIKDLTKNFNSKRLEIYKKLIETPEKDNKALLEIENALKNKEKELAKIYSEKLKSTILERMNAVNEVLENQIDQYNELLGVTLLGEKIKEMVKKFVYSETKTGEIKFVKGNWDDKANTPKISKLGELATEINGFNVYFLLGEIGRKAYLTSFNYIESLNFENEQRRIIEEENARKELEKVKAEEERMKLEQETAIRRGNIETRAVENANVVEVEEVQEVEISSTTKLLIELDNAHVEQFKAMLNKNNINWKEVE